MIPPHARFAGPAAPRLATWRCLVIHPSLSTRPAGWAVAALAVFLLPAGASAETVHFATEVAAVLSRAGCNQGSCHGNLNGKGGLKLSLRGEDPAWDYRVLTRDSLGRRVDPLRPEQSLLLQKPAG